MSKEKLDKFKTLSYEDFKNLAKDDSLSKYEKIGFPDSYREGKEKLIFDDIFKKLDFKNLEGKLFLDIGIGCSELSEIIIEFTANNKMKLLAIDSKEMLDLIDDFDHVSKVAGYFPDETVELIENHQNKVDYILCYSIFQYVFYNTCIFKFIDSALSLLKPNGKLLIADLPNISKRKRFFTSDTGIKFHKEYTNSNTLPEVEHLKLEPSQIDDGVIFSIMQRYRNCGYETYLLPQSEDLPMANRREDLLIVKI